ncbi:hypothetical protein [Treponema sp. R80B11-R83G3]
METQINISSKQAIISLFLNMKKDCINIAEVFLLQNYINGKNDKTIHMNIRYEDIKRTVKYNEELFFMTEYRILLREEQFNPKQSENKIPVKIKKIVKEYVKRNKAPLLPFQNNFIDDV